MEDLHTTDTRSEKIRIKYKLFFNLSFSRAILVIVTVHYYNNCLCVIIYPGILLLHYATLLITAMSTNIDCQSLLPSST